MENGRLRLGFPLPGVDADGAYFFPAEDGRLTYSAPQAASRTGDILLIETAAAGAAQPVSGVLRLADGRGFAVRATPGAVPRAEAESSAGGVFATTAVAFLGAVLGGLLTLLIFIGEAVRDAFDPRRQAGTQGRSIDVK